MKRPTKAAISIGLGVLALAAGSSPALGKAHLDKSFGKGGIAQFIGTDLPQGLAVAPGGRIYSLSSGRDGKSVITAIRPNGSLDRKFGDRGKVDTGSYPDPGSYAVGEDIQVTPSGKILVAGPERNGGEERRNCAIVEKFRPGGALAVGFGKRGRERQCVNRVRSKKRPRPYFGFTPTSIDITGNGKVLVAGRAVHGGSDAGIAVARFNRDGSLDRSFRGDRRTRSPQPGIIEILHRREDWGTAQEVLAIRRGQILVAGRQGSIPLIAKLNADGTLDRNFGRRGIFNFRLKGYGPCKCSDEVDIDIDSRGRIVLMTYLWMPGGPSHGTVIIRLTKRGRLDPGFGNRGWARPYNRKAFYPDAMAVQNDDRIVVLGDYRGPTGGSGTYALFRLRPGGSRDRSFFDKGLFHPHRNFLEAAGSGSDRQIVIDGRGRILANSGWFGGWVSVLRIVP